MNKLLTIRLAHCCSALIRTLGCEGAQQDVRSACGRALANLVHALPRTTDSPATTSLPQQVCQRHMCCMPSQSGCLHALCIELFATTLATSMQHQSISSAAQADSHPKAVSLPALYLETQLFPALATCLLPTALQSKADQPLQPASSASLKLLGAPAPDSPSVDKADRLFCTQSKRCPRHTLPQWAMQIQVCMLLQAS